MLQKKGKWMKTTLLPKGLGKIFSDNCHNFRIL